MMKWLVASYRLISPSSFILQREVLRSRNFARLACLAAKALPPRLVLSESDLEESFLKGSGPGGQKINKTNSAVQLKHLPSGIVVKCQETRSRTQNRKLARRLLADQLDELENGEQSRNALKRQAAAKKKASKTKKARRKYRLLDEKKIEQLGDESVANVTNTVVNEEHATRGPAQTMEQCTTTADVAESSEAFHSRRPP